MVLSNEIEDLPDKTLEKGNISVQAGIDGNSVLPASGYYNNWHAQSLVIPEGLSSAGWTMEAVGYAQQTFLGGSIRSFNMNGGFGDTSSNLTVELVNDEYNFSDGKGYGLGVDEYHGGQRDFVFPPVPGTPVFFKFGQWAATTEQAYRKSIDLISGYNTFGESEARNSIIAYNNYMYNVSQQNPSNRTYHRYGANAYDDHLKALNGNFISLENYQIYNLKSYTDIKIVDQTKGEFHLVFGGLLQSFLQNRSSAGNPLYSVQVTDPREILSNVMILLNNYSGSTFNEKNMLNVYGFLEFNLSDADKNKVKNKFGSAENKLVKHVVTKGANIGQVSYSGELVDSLPPPPIGQWYAYEKDCYVQQGTQFGFGKKGVSNHFPITGTGFARRSPQGIPFYRVKQGIQALLEVGDPLPQPYVDAGFSTQINFHGHNYVVDFGGLPDLPELYFVDFDQISLLDLCLEICDVANKDLFVSLLPVINHPYCSSLKQRNVENANKKELFISGIIRIDTIDRSVAPQYGAIKSYIDSLARNGIQTENEDLGYELTNVVTNKFIVGAQEVDHYFFSANQDKDYTEARALTSQSVNMDQWLLEKQLEQQILPYYGLLGNSAITIPKGWGPYQQILLDSTGVTANGVGAYYVATEMELRYASVSYKAWSDFLLGYNDLYMEKMDGNLTKGAMMTMTPNLEGFAPPNNVANAADYGVSVPRSVFDTYALTEMGTDELPLSPCNPPYGYPLYYKRATKIGIPQGGLTGLSSRIVGMITAISKGVGADKYKDIRDSLLAEIDALTHEGTMSATERSYYTAIRNELKKNKPNVAVLNSIAAGLHRIQAILPRLAKKGVENAMKVYNFVKKVADENLGKKYLVKMPQRVNTQFSYEIKYDDQNPLQKKYKQGPFGFKPISTSRNPQTQFMESYWSAIKGFQTGPEFIKEFLKPTGNWYSNTFIGQAIPAATVGALRGNFNPLVDKYEFNYTPTNVGGFFPFDLCSNVFGSDVINSMDELKRPPGIKYMLIPQDLTNFITPEGRITPYVRFDNSQGLAMHQLSPEDYTQQVVPLNQTIGMIPDLVDALDNTNEDQDSFASCNANRPDVGSSIKSCAFVKCTVDENFYMAPRTVEKNIKVFGGAPTSTPKLSKPSKIFIPCSGWSNGPGSSLVPGTGCYVDSYRQMDLLFTPTKDATGSARRLDYVRYPSPILGSYMIDTDIKHLDTNHVYALITLPNKVVPTKISRYRDAINFGEQHWHIQRYLTMDVVKNLPEFDSPGYTVKPSPNTFIGDCKDANAIKNRSAAWLAANQAKKALKFGGPTVLNYSVPSPVSPDLVALPLISKDRCYGPWLSSQLDPQGKNYKDIGGKIEFIKDENLSPWNYAGYDLLNIAGSLQASFTSNLLLFSERGGFTVPGAPAVNLCSALIAGGPLVTNISVDVSTGGIKTTYKMDLYTPSFGKLQKQKQELISKISRERQKLREERNSLIRKGISKAQSSIGIGNLNQAASAGNIDTFMRNVPPTHLVASLSYSNVPYYTPNNFGDSNYGAGGNNAVPDNEGINDAALQHEDDINHMANQYDSEADRNAAAADAGATKLSDIYTPYSNAPYHPSLPNIHYAEPRAIDDFFISDNDD